jgi:hypothetical protein
LSDPPSKEIYRVSVKVKVKVSLCFFLTEHHAMKAYWGCGSIAPLIHNQLTKQLTNLGQLDLNGKIKLKCILGKFVVKLWLTLKNFEETVMNLQVA